VGVGKEGGRGEERDHLSEGIDFTLVLHGVWSPYVSPITYQFTHSYKALYHFKLLRQVGEGEWVAGTYAASL
jgi:hypothetical protein